MKTIVTGILLSICFLLSLPAKAAPADGATPLDVITRLVANASKNPPGPVEDDVTHQLVNHVTENLILKKDSGSLSEIVARDFNFFTLDEAPASLHSKDGAAVFSGPAKLSNAMIHASIKELPFSADGGPGFGEWGGWQYLNDKIKTDGHVYATFCLAQQRGVWKVHFLYISNAPLNDDQKKFIINAVDGFSKKP